MATAFRSHVNWGYGELLSAYAAGSGTLVLKAGQGAAFGSPSPAHPLAVTVAPKAVAFTTAMGAGNCTIFAVTARSGDTLTVAATEGTADRNYAAGDAVLCAPTAADLDAIQTALNTAEDAVAAAVPGGSTTQVQYNNAGAFGGSSKLTFNAATGGLKVQGTVSNAGTGTNLTLAANDADAGPTFTVSANGEVKVNSPFAVGAGAQSYFIVVASPSNPIFWIGSDGNSNVKNDLWVLGTIHGNGSLVTNLAAGNLATGTVPTARLGSGTADTSTFLRGDNAWQRITGGRVGWVLGAGTPLSVGTDKTAWAVLGQARALARVDLCAKTAPAGSSLILDILYSTDSGTNWTSLWAVTPANRPTLAAGSKSGTVSAFDTATVPAGAVLRIDVVQVGSTAAGQDLTVGLKYWE